MTADIINNFLATLTKVERCNSKKYLEKTVYHDYSDIPKDNWAGLFIKLNDLGYKIDRRLDDSGDRYEPILISEKGNYHMVLNATALKFFKFISSEKKCENCGEKAGTRYNNYGKKSYLIGTGAKKGMVLCPCCYNHEYY